MAAQELATGGAVATLGAAVKLGPAVAGWSCTTGRLAAGGAAAECWAAPSL